MLSVAPSSSAAGWRSADRPGRDEPVVEEPCERDGTVDPQWQGGERDEWSRGSRDGGEWQGGRVHRHHDHADSMPPQATQPYWGTMRPYWNGPEPPGVIHRQPRTAPLKIQKQR